MVVFDANIPRWIASSFSKHFEAARSTYTFMCQGQQVEDKEQNPVFELSLNVHKYKITADYIKATVSVLILIKTEISDKDLYRMERLIGLMLAAFKPFSVFKYGTGPDDNSTTVLGCAKPAANPGDNSEIIVTNFGQISPKVQLQQSSIEGYFLVEIGS